MSIDKVPELSLSERLIVAADFGPDPNSGSDNPGQSVKDQLMRLVDDLGGTGVIIKVNSALRLVGYGLIDTLHSAGLKVMADLKLCDIPATMKTDAALLRAYAPEIVTIMAPASIDGMMAVQDVVGDKTQVLGVTVLTSFDEEECQAVFGCSTKAGVLRFARYATLARIGGLVCSPQELEMLAKHKELQGWATDRVTPGVRPNWVHVPGDDQKRVMTPFDAMKAGARRVVLGRPILNPEAKDGGKISRGEAIERTIAEIEAGISARATTGT